MVQSGPTVIFTNCLISGNSRRAICVKVGGQLYSGGHTAAGKWISASTRPEAIGLDVPGVFSSLTLVSCIIRDNYGDAAVWIQGGTLNIASSSFVSNSGSTGGALYVYFHCRSLSITSTLFEDNVGISIASALYFLAKSPSVSSAEFTAAGTYIGLSTELKDIPTFLKDVSFRIGPTAMAHTPRLPIISTIKPLNWSCPLGNWSAAAGVFADDFDGCESACVAGRFGGSPYLNHGSDCTGTPTYYLLLTTYY